MTPDTWFEQLAAALSGRAETDADGSRTPPSVTDDERDALLDLARVAAHTSERWTAPVSTFLVGVALHGVPAGDRAAVLRRLVTELEPPS
jgi:hypothetical protein